MVNQSAASVLVPLPAQVCLGFIEQLRAKHCRFSDDIPCAVTSANSHESSEGSTKLPVLLGARRNYSKQYSSLKDLSIKSPTNAGDQSTSTSGDDLESSNSTSSWKIEVKNTFVHMVDSSDDEKPFSRSRTEPTHSASQPCTAQIQRYPDRKSYLPPSRSPCLSVGSALHGTGSCRPCAWFWKPQGCGNGDNCRHCHMCSQDEIKRRRKGTHATRRKKGGREVVSTSLQQE